MEKKRYRAHRWRWAKTQIGGQSLIVALRGGRDTRSTGALNQIVLRGLLMPEALHHFFFQEEDGIRDPLVTGVQTCALPISSTERARMPRSWRSSIHGSTGCQRSR